MENSYKKLLLGCSSALFSMILSTETALALGGCLANDCTGYTKSSTQCSGKTAIRCPFDTSKYYCQDDVDVPCGDAYKYDCTGTGYTGGSGQECGGKFAACECDSSLDYAWNGTTCSSTCSSDYKYDCSRMSNTSNGSSADKCGGLYKACNCYSGYHWGVNPSDSYGNSQCMVDTHTIEVCLKTATRTNYYPTGTFDATVTIDGSTQTASGPGTSSTSDTNWHCTEFKATANSIVKINFYGKINAGTSCQAYEVTTSVKTTNSNTGSTVYANCRKGQYSQQVEMGLSGFYYLTHGSKTRVEIVFNYSQWTSCGEISVNGCNGPFQ